MTEWPHFVIDVIAVAVSTGAFYMFHIFSMTQDRESKTRMRSYDEGRAKRGFPTMKGPSDYSVSEQTDKAITPSAQETLEKVRPSLMDNMLNPTRKIRIPTEE